MARFCKAGEGRQCAFGIGWVMQVKVRFSVAGMVRLVMLRRGTAGFGRRGELWFVPERCVVAGLVGYGMVGSCTVCLGLAGELWLGWERFCAVRSCMVW